MLKIDNSLLEEIGLGGLPANEKNGFLRHVYETLEMRVGVRLADQMSNEQLDEFERYFEAKDDAGAFKWLETNFPNYKDIVQEEFDKLKAEITQSAPQILAASQAQAAQAAQTQAPPQAVPGQQPQQQAPPTPPAAGQHYQQPQPQSPAGTVPPAPAHQGPYSLPAQPPNPIPPAPPSYPDQQPPPGPQPHQQ